MAGQGRRSRCCAACTRTLHFSEHASHLPVMNLQSLHVLQRPQLCSEHAAIPQLHHGPQSPLIREFPTFIKEMKVKILTPMKTAENRVNGQSPAAHPTVDADTDQHSLALHL